ncbi:MAG: 4a-hydroxytetrahydrobiopterin dehydratase [Chloroflexi bacterium]|nr:4a-hydroxytetrahydrobiopterin dehydratase [Chloroflexota bacterium]
METLDDAEIARRLDALPQWRREGDAICREYELPDFVEALGLIARIGALAERANHHPTLTSSYNRLRVELSTHDAGGITERDFALARAIEERAV